MHLLSSLAFTPTFVSVTVLVVTPWSSSSSGCPRNNITTRLYCTIYKRTGHIDHFYHHSRSCNHYKKTGHTERECFNLYPELIVQAQQWRKQQGLPPVRTSSTRSRSMSIGTIQPLPSDPTDIQHRLAQIELQLQLQLQSAFTRSSASAFSAASGMSFP